MKRAEIKCTVLTNFVVLQYLFLSELLLITKAMCVQPHNGDLPT